MFLLLFLIIGFLRGNSTEISGYNKEYAGRKLTFFKYSDPVTREKIHVFSLDIDAAGRFNGVASVEKTTFVFSEFGIYRGNLFLEPGQRIELLLPPLRQKTFAERKNPYFSPVDFWFATREGNQLNDKISAFDDQLNQLTDMYFNQIYFRQSKSAFDTIQMKLEKQFQNDNSRTFVQHKQLKLKTVEADAFRVSTSKTAATLAQSDMDYWMHPAFIDLFEKTFAGKLSFEANAAQDNKIRKAVLAQNVDFFTEFIKNNYGVNIPFSDLVLLKMLHDGFYSGDFPQENILNMVANTHFTSNKNHLIREAANNVINKLQHLRKGSKAPVICLYDINGKKVCTDKENNKFTYLIFADTEMVVCREQLKYLTKINEVFERDLDIVVVLLKTDIIEMKKFLIEEIIPVVHLVDANNEFIEKYRIKSYPTCYLLNSSHEIVFQETKAPLDGFEQQFGTYLQKERFIQQRNQSR